MTSSGRPKEDELIDGRYQIRHLISSGSFGTVYLAYDQNLSREVAVKIVNVPGDMSIDQEMAKRLIREAQALSLLKHPGVIEVYRLGFLADKRPFLVMEFVDSQSLDAFLETSGPMSCRDAAALAIQLAEALSHTHKQGVLHRDIKPQNVLIENTASGLRARLVDFGLGAIKEEFKRDRSRLTMTGETVGTPQYMCPEQCRGEALDARSDIYALGLVLFEMLTGQPAFAGEDPSAVYHKQLHEALPKLARLDRLANFPAVLQEILDKSTAKSRESRYQTMEEMLADLQVLAAENCSAKLDRSRVSTSEAPAASSRIALLVPAAALVLLALAAAISWSICTPSGERAFCSLAAGLLPSRQALPVISAMETLASWLRGPSGAVEFGQAALDCKSSQLWTAEERFDLQLDTFKHAGPNPPIAICFPLALAIIEQGPELLLVRTESASTEPAGTKPVGMMAGKLLMRVLEGQRSPTRHYIVPSRWRYMAPLTDVSTYLLHARPTLAQWQAIHKVTSQQARWRWDLLHFENPASDDLFASVEQLAETSNQYFASPAPDDPAAAKASQVEFQAILQAGGFAPRRARGGHR